MDGASKFVKGDAVAGLLILGINIIGRPFYCYGGNMTFSFRGN